MPLRNLLREPLRKFKPYVVGKSIDDVRREYSLTGRIAKLASNENPLGSSPLAVAAMHRAVEDVSLYPDDTAGTTARKVAERYAVSLANVFAASGSVEVLELLAVAFLEPGDVVVSSEKTFAMYALAAEKAGAEFRAAPMTDGGYRYDLEAMAAPARPGGEARLPGQSDQSDRDLVHRGGVRSVHGAGAAGHAGRLRLGLRGVHQRRGPARSDGPLPRRAGGSCSCAPSARPTAWRGSGSATPSDRRTSSRG